MNASRRPFVPIMLVVVLIKAAVLALAGTRYGYLSDELYFLDAAARPAWGYVDLPPFLPWLLAALEVESLFALRVMATVIGAAVILTGVDLCRVLGGRPAAGWLVALVLSFAPGFLSVQSIMTMNVLDQLWWMWAFWLGARYLQTQRSPYVLALGAVLGLGLLTKWSAVALCLAFPVALLVWERRILLSPAPWLGAGLALIITSPHLAWQISNDWPAWQFVSAYNATPPNAIVLQNPLLGMVLTMNPAYALFWGPGAIFVFASKDRTLCVLGTVAWLCLVLFIAVGVKFYFAVPAFGLFVIAGALFWQQLAEGRATLWRRVPMLVALSGVLALPGAVPLLSETRLQAFTAFLRDSEQGYPGLQPPDLERYFPHFAEMHGWRELVELTVGRWQALGPSERRDAVIVAAHYGQAGALNQLADPGQLPQAHARHMTYHLWGRGLALDRGLFVGFTADELEPLFARVEARGRLDCENCMARERGLIVHYVAEPRLPHAEIWARLKRYDFF
jgi:hypothetical protein